MNACVLIHFERADDIDSIALVGIYDTVTEARHVMQALYNHVIASVGDWQFDLCGCDASNAVVQDEYHICHRWFIFDNNDAGIYLKFT